MSIPSDSVHILRVAGVVVHAYDKIDDVPKDHGFITIADNKRKVYIPKDEMRTAAIASCADKNLSMIGWLKGVIYAFFNVTCTFSKQGTSFIGKFDEGIKKHLGLGKGVDHFGVDKLLIVGDKKATEVRKERFERKEVADELNLGNFFERHEIIADATKLFKSPAMEKMTKKGWLLNAYLPVTNFQRDFDKVKKGDASPEEIKATVGKLRNVITEKWEGLVAGHGDELNELSLKLQDIENSMKKDV